MHEIVSGIWDLGIWRPNLPHSKTMRPYYYQNKLVQECFEARVESPVIAPELRTPLYKPDQLILTWHTDYNNSREIYILVWSNLIPTEVKRYDSKKPLKSLKPWHIYAIDNGAFVHKTPKYEGGRWFARAYVKKPIFQKKESRI